MLLRFFMAGLGIARHGICLGNQMALMPPKLNSVPVRSLMRHQKHTQLEFALPGVSVGLGNEKDSNGLGYASP